METQERKKEIITTAFKLIAEKGVEEFTIKNISRSIGISEPAMYRHFASKNDILRALIEEICYLWEKNWAHVIASYESELEQLVQFYISRAKEFDAFPSLSIIMFPDIIFAGSPELMKNLMSMTEENKSRHMYLIESLQNRGVFTSAIPQEHIFTMLTGGFRLLVSSWSMQRKLGNLYRLEEKTRDFISSTVQFLCSVSVT